MRTLTKLFLGLGLALFLSGFPARGETIKVRVTVDNANVKATPEIGGQNLARVPLDSVLEAEAKQGEWYKVSLMREGVQISGFIHEMLVKEISGNEPPPTLSPEGKAKSQAEIVAEIDLKMEEAKKLVRQENEPDKAIDGLSPLVAKAFTIDDREKQRRTACELYLWIGLAEVKKGDPYAALREFRNMFEVDSAYAREITRNISDPAVSGFIEQADKQFRGVLVEYTLEITTRPKEAAIKVNGKPVGLSPEVYKTTMPKLLLEIEKEGYKTIREELFLSQSATTKDYALESIGRTVAVTSVPKEARVYLDGADTGKLTDCELPFVAYGEHKLRLVKENYADWEAAVRIAEGAGPLRLPASLAPKNYVFFQKWGGPEVRLFKLPKAVALDKDGNFYVVDEGDVKLKKIDPAGRVQINWGDGGKESRGLKSPAGIALDGQGNIYVTDARGSCLVKFASSGKLLARWGEEGSKPGELNNPSGVAVDAAGDVYVVDSGNNRIVKYSPGGAVKKIWGKQGSERGEFVFPSAITVNQENEVFVVDRARVQKFSPEGAFMDAWGKPGSGPGELKGPVGACIDGQNYIYLADSGNNKIMKFDPKGNLISQWGAAGAADGQMLSPLGVAANDKGSIFVIERDNQRLQEFRVASNK